MATPTAPVLGADGTAARDLALEEAVFAAEVKPHVLHETVRAEQNARRAGTRAVKSRGLVAGGRSKPWRQKGTGRARQGTIRAPHFSGGGAAFQLSTSYDVKVNRKVRRSALRGALSAHAAAGTLGLVDADSFETPSTKAAKALVEAWGKDAPLVLVACDDEEALVKSFRNLPRVAVTLPSELEVTALLWARSVLISEKALPLVQGRAA
jgi:large subunit ribosomal protein L4